MSADSWGNTRNPDGVNRRICMSNLPASCTVRNIMELYGRDNLEGVSITRSGKGFVQFKRPLDCSRALQQHTLTFHNCPIRIKPYVELSDPPSKRIRTVSSTSRRYLRAATPERDESLSTSSRFEEKRDNSNGWGTPTTDNYIDHACDRDSLSRKQDSRANTTFSCEKSDENCRLAMSNGQIAGDEQATRTDAQRVSKHHLQIVNYAANQNCTTGTHTFGQSAVTPVPSLPSSVAQHSSHLHTFGENIIYTQAEKEAIVSCSASSAHSVAKSSDLVGNINPESSDVTLKSPVDFLLEVILKERSARSLSVLQINMIQEYLQQEKQVVFKRELEALEASKSDLAPVPKEPSTSSENVTGSKPSSGANLDPLAQKMLEKLRSLKEN